METLLIIAAIILALLLVWLLYFYIPIKMARERGRSTTASVLLCFILSPILTYIILALLGDSHEKIERERHNYS